MWNREKDDAGNGRTRASILRAAISNASNERSSRQWARAALFEHAVAPEEAREALVKHSALPQWLGGHQSSISQFWSRFERHLSSILRLWGTLERPFREPAAAPGQARAVISRASCGSGPGSTGHFELAAAPGQAQTAISSQRLGLRPRHERPFRASCGSRAGSSGHFASQRRLWARLERPFRDTCGFGSDSTGHFEPCAAPGQARGRKCRQGRFFRARSEPGKLHSFRSPKPEIRKKL